MGFIEFFIGLGIGTLILGWYQSRSNRKIKQLLNRLQPEVAEDSSSIASQLSLAIAYQHRSQTRLEHQLETYRQLLQLAPIGFLFVDDENRLVWCNSEARQLLRMPIDSETEPRLLLELVRSYELDELIEKIRTSQKPSQLEWTFYPYNPDPIRLSKQESYVLRGHGFPVLDNNVGIFIECRQEAIILAQQRDRWASDVAHELKTPLTSIRLIAETLQSRLDSNLKGWTERLIGQITRLSDLVQDLLELGKLEQDAFESLNFSMLNLIDLIDSAWNSLEPIARKKNLKLVYEGPDQLILQLDEVRFYRVLVNLFDNSIKFSPPWGIIQVRVTIVPQPSENPSMSSDNEPLNDFICLDIVDMGTGFLEQDLPYIFDRFYRADSSRTRLSQPLSKDVVTFSSDNDQEPSSSKPIQSKPIQSKSNERSHQSTSGPSQLSPRTDRPPSASSSDGKRMNQGSGLGLSIVRQIVEAHRGSVTAKNHPETGGAWLQIKIPHFTEMSQSNPVHRLSSLSSFPK